MKEIKIIAIAVAITIVMMIATACAMPACAESNPDYGEFYPRLSIMISSIHADNGLWVITCQDKEGNRWAFFSDEDDWQTGDICNLLMWNIDTDITLHEVVEVYWEGYTEEISLWKQINGWR